MPGLQQVVQEVAGLTCMQKSISLLHNQ